MARVSVPVFYFAQSLPTFPSHYVHPLMLPPLLRVQDVTVIRGDTRLVDCLSLEIPQGQNVAIVGPNGAGKSTLLRLLLRQLYPSIMDAPPAGKIEILGAEVWNVWEMRCGMGIVSPELDRVFPTAAARPIGVRDAVVTGFFGSQLPPPVEAIHAGMWERVEQVLAQVEMLAFKDRTLDTLSTGELRRVMIARALVHHPTSLVLDEPTTGLDMGARHHFLNLLRELIAGGLSLLLVTHHIEEIVPEIERVILMEQGKVAEDGAKAAILTSEKLSRLFGAPVAVQIDQNGFYSARSWMDARDGRPHKRSPDRGSPHKRSLGAEDDPLRISSGEAARGESPPARRESAGT